MQCLDPEFLWMSEFAIEVLLPKGEGAESPSERGVLRPNGTKDPLCALRAG
jgi:hypothetical protein